MKFKRTISAVDMRRVNRTAILDLIRMASPISRSNIAKTLGISLPTVMRQVDKLIHEGIVRQLEETEKTGGRRSPLVELNAEDNMVIGINLSNNNNYGAVANIGGEILKEVEMPRVSDDAETNYNDIIQIIDTLLSSRECAGKAILGIGVGAPGVTQHKTGMVVWAPTMNWRNFPLRDRLMEKYNYPVIVENDINLTALGEMWYGSGKNRRNYVVLSIGAGTGAALVLDGFLYRGAHEAAGEIGYQVPDIAYLSAPRSNFGSMEHVASGVGIIKRIKKVLINVLPEEELQAVNLDTLFSEDIRISHLMKPVIENTIDHIALMVSSLASFLDPEVIIFTGRLSNYSDIIIPGVEKRLANLLPAGVKLNIRQSELGARACPLGAITVVLNHTFEQHVVRLID